MKKSAKTQTPLEPFGLQFLDTHELARVTGAGQTVTAYTTSQGALGVIYDDSKLDDDSGGGDPEGPFVPS